MKQENIIELRNISKTYEDNAVLKNLNLDIKKDEFLTLLGPSGCGKTTTLKIIAGFEFADDGKVLLAGVIEKTFINGKWHKQMLFDRIHGE